MTGFKKGRCFNRRYYMLNKLHLTLSTLKSECIFPIILFKLLTRRTRLFLEEPILMRKFRLRLTKIVIAKNDFILPIFCVRNMN